MSNQQLVEFIEEKNFLLIRLTDEGKEWIKEFFEEERAMGIDQALGELFEYQLCNGWDALSDTDMQKCGMITGCAWILTQEDDRDDHHNLLALGRVYWNPNYAVENELETLRDKGEMRWEGHGDPLPDPCECGHPWSSHLSEGCMHHDDETEICVCKCQDPRAKR